MGNEYGSVLEAVGKTPLIRLDRMAEGLAAEIYVKAEFLNPGGSVKDRIALKMVEAAEREGLLQSGGTIVEATAGNTGIGLAMAASIKGYRCVFSVPDKMSSEKISLLRAYGAEVVITPSSVAPDSPESYNGVADRLAREIPGAWRPGQFSNPENPLAHYCSTGPEIWSDSGGKIDVLVAGMGTGGTVSGTGRYLKEKKPEMLVIGADPEGSILSGGSPRPYMVEGIGEDFIPKTFCRQVVDEMIRVSDAESFLTARRLAREEGILAGGSSGTALAAAIKYAKRLERPEYIVAILPDTGRNYADKIFSDRWMEDNGFLEKETGGRARAGEILDGKRDFPALVSVSSSDTLGRAASLMRRYNISQVPVIDGDEIKGSLNESSLMRLLYEGADFEKLDTGSVMGNSLPAMDENTEVSEIYRVLLSGESGVIIKRGGRPAGLLTRADVINYWMERKRERSR